MTIRRRYRVWHLLALCAVVAALATIGRRMYDDRRAGELLRPFQQQRRQSIEWYSLKASEIEQFQKLVEAHPAIARQRGVVQWAVSATDEATVKQLLDGGGAPDQVDAYFRTPLSVAARQGKPRLVRLLAGRGADVRQDVWLTPFFTGDRGTLLHVAVESGFVETAEFLIAEGVPLDEPVRPAKDLATGNLGWTALHFAANNDHLDMARLLIEKGADVNRRSASGWTAMMLAAQAKRGSDETEKLDELRRELASREIMRLLRKRGAEVDPFSMIAFGDVEALRQYLENHPEATELRDPDGNGLLHWSAIHRLAEALKILLAHGADPDARGAEQCTPLHVAAYGEWELGIGMLIDAGADIRAQNEGIPFELIRYSKAYGRKPEPTPQ